MDLSSGEKPRIWEETCSTVLTAALFTIAKTWEQAKDPHHCIRQNFFLFYDWVILHCMHTNVYTYVYTYIYIYIYMYTSSVTQSCPTLCPPWTAALQASLSITDSWSLLKLISIESVIPSNHLILCHPLLLLPSILHNIRVFSNESVICIRWNIGASASASVLPMNIQDWFL